MANLFFELFHQLDDNGRLNKARRLTDLGKMSKARRGLFEVLTNREERFGEKSPECIEVFIWIAGLHFVRASENLELALFLLRNISQQGFVSQYPRIAHSYMTRYVSVSEAINKELRSSHSVLRYAEKQLEEVSLGGVIAIRLQIALLQIDDCFSGEYASRDQLSSSCSAKLRKERVSIAFAQAESLLTQTPDYRKLDCIDYLVEFVVLQNSQSSDSEYSTRAARLKTKTEEQRALLVEYEAELTLYTRPA